MHTDAHTHTQSSLHSPALISSWLSASCYSAGDDTHARTHPHTHTVTRTCTSSLRSLKSHSCFLPNHCSHKTLAKTERKLNKPRRPNEAVGHSFKSIIGGCIVQYIRYIFSWVYIPELGCYSARDPFELKRKFKNAE